MQCFLQTYMAQKKVTRSGDMKLYPLLFLNEVAKSTEDALGEGVAVIVTNIWGSGTAIILFDTKKAIDVLKKETSVYDSSEKLYEAGGIVALINFTKEDNDLYKVNASAGVSNYGPLAYQIAMQHIGNKNWLMCDTTLKPASEFVWQKMFELSNKGIYKREWLGKEAWGSTFLLWRMAVTEAAKTDLEEYVKKIKRDEVDYKNEQQFLDWLKEKGLSPEKYGYLWAYNLSSPINPSELYTKGKETVEFLKKDNYPKFTINDVVKIIAEAVQTFFTEMYGSEASYLE